MDNDQTTGVQETENRKDTQPLTSTKNTTVIMSKWSWEKS